jgi:hypothetical protein
MLDEQSVEDPEVKYLPYAYLQGRLRYSTLMIRASRSYWELTETHVKEPLSVQVSVTV